MRWSRVPPSLRRFIVTEEEEGWSGGEISSAECKPDVSFPGCVKGERACAGEGVVSATCKREMLQPGCAKLQDKMWQGILRVYDDVNWACPWGVLDDPAKPAPTLKTYPPYSEVGVVFFS